MNTKSLVLFVFPTGDGSCPYYEVYALVEHAENEYLTENLFRRSLEEAQNTTKGEDVEYEDVVKNAMKIANVPWRFAPIPIGNIYRAILVYA